MDHIRILRRAFEITRFYRALWVFGILVALTTSRGGGNGGGNGGSSNGPTPGQPPNFPDFQWPPAIPQDVLNTIVAVGVAVVCLLVLVGIAFAILHYLSQTSLIRMVNGYESTGERVSVRQGFRLGWSRGAFRTWLADLLFFIVGFTITILLLLLAAAPLLLWLTRDRTAGIVGTVIAIGLAMLVILVLVIVGTAISMWTQMIRREIVLGGKGVLEGIAGGWRMLTRHLGDVIIMGLILFGVGLGLAVLTIPLFFLLAATGVLAGGLPALLAGGITNIFVHGNTPQMVAATVGIPIFLLVILIPLTFIGGLAETFYSTTWTLTYRELLAMEAVRSEPPASPGPEPEPVV
jgi:hypothetical protein